MEKQTNFLNSTGSRIKKQPTKISYELFVDGAARGNPGPSGAGIYIKYSDATIVKKGFFIGRKTNNQAEYLALAIGIHLILQKDKHPTFIKIHSDSELLVKQMQGKYRVKNQALFQIKILIDNMLQDINYTIRHILRDKNKVADAMANEGIDKKNKIPTTFVSLLKKIG